MYFYSRFKKLKFIKNTLFDPFSYAERKLEKNHL